jgi:hypothetical protein
VDDKLHLDAIASLESSTPSNRANLQKKQSTVVKDTISHIHKGKQNNASISSSMCFSASVVIDSSSINELLLVVEAFAVFFDHFFCIHFLLREANCKCDNTDNSENVTKVVNNSPVELLPLECTTCRGLKGHFPYDPSSTLSYQMTVNHLHAHVGTN